MSTKSPLYSKDFKNKNAFFYFYKEDIGLIPYTPSEESMAN